MEDIKNYLVEKKAYTRGFLQYKHWSKVVAYFLETIDRREIKKTFNELVKEDLFYVEKRGYRFYYKYKSRDEPPVDKFILYF
tara:strand:- start:3536 stop:3781 length:246 start_codon:yes stop_codon:yes gene_type:complete